MIDLSLPGYKYLGPGNDLDKGVPNGYNDFVAFLHDHGYNVIIDRGGNPYFQWSGTYRRTSRIIYSRLLHNSYIIRGRRSRI